MRLTPPKQTIFYISVSLAIISVVLRPLIYAGILTHLPIGLGGYLILLIAYLVLLAGNVLKGV